MGWIYYKKTDLENANSFLRSAALLAPNDPAVLFHWAVIKEARRETKDALDLYLQAQRSLSHLLPFDLASDEEFERIAAILPNKIALLQVSPK